MKTNIVFGALLGLVLLSGCASTPERFGDYERTRQEVLNELKSALKLPEKYDMRAIPSISAGALYGVGSVFRDDLYPARYTAKCVIPKSKVLSGSVPGIGAALSSRKFELSGQIPSQIVSASKKFDSVGFGVTSNKTASMEYSNMSVSTTDVADLFRQLKTKECIGDIGNRPALVLLSVYKAKQVFKSGKAVDDSEDSEAFKANATVALADEELLKISYTNDGSFVVEDSEAQPRIWVVLPVIYNVPGLTDDMSPAERERIARDYLRIESNARDSEDPMQGFLFVERNFGVEEAFDVK